MSHATVVAVTWRHVPETRDPDATAPIDVTGGVLATAGLILIWCRPDPASRLRSDGC
jgi:hypothetical protein